MDTVDSPVPFDPLPIAKLLTPTLSLSVPIATVDSPVALDDFPTAKLLVPKL